MYIAMDDQDKVVV